ncbi:MAG: glutamate 5-kinase [Cellvibrionaceae bacterium]|nr:glutamate 5-kinase [Cellvibrionaceae bacterium]
MSKRQVLHQARCWVIKIGSALLTANGKGLNVAAIESWARQIAQLQQQQMHIVLVSSGAVAAGMSRLGWQQRPASIHRLQAAAAIGQMGLVQTYEHAFQRHGLQAAQVLVDHDDLSNRERYLNARATLKTLLDFGVIPVVNENDTVVTDEIRFGDNDTLAALVANLVEADVLLLMTDQLGMYNADPRQQADAVLIDEIPAIDPALDAMASEGGHLGRGGMVTKVRAARLAARSGTHTLIVGGDQPDVIRRVAKGETLGTLLFADQQPQAARKRWLAGQLQSRGELILDDGAVRVLKQSGRSLLPVGIQATVGLFTRGDLVVCKNRHGHTVARGLVNYNAKEAEKIIGQPSDAIEALLGYKNEEEMIHRDNLVLV